MSEAKKPGKARKPREANAADALTGKGPKAVAATAAGRKPPHPTYPLSPSEIEIAGYIAWDGKAFVPSERAPKEAIALTGEDLQSYLVRLPFLPQMADVANRHADVSISSGEDFQRICHRLHRLQITTPDGRMPEALSGDDWIAGKPGVRKSDGMGILLVRPAF